MVAVGGALGAAGRYRITEWAKGKWGDAFPWGTLIVNVAGSLMLGLLLGLVLTGKLPKWSRYAAGAGFMGALTTFSTFSVDTVLLLRAGKVAAALGNVTANVLVGLVAAAVGLWLSSHST